MTPPGFNPIVCCDVELSDGEAAAIDPQGALDLRGFPAGADDPALAEAALLLTRRTPIDAAMIARADRCLGIVYLGPGAGPGVPAIDLEAARRAGIYVSSIPDYASDAWAAEAMELIEQVAALAGHDALAGLRLGLVGLGEVGRRVARLATARRMQLWACDPFCAKDVFENFGVRPAPLDELIGMTQIVSLHVPLGPATHGMIGADRLLLFQRGTALVNTSRPELVELAALAEALGRGRPAVAAFNTAPDEFLIADHALRQAPDCMARPSRVVIDAAVMGTIVQRAARIGSMIVAGQRPLHLLIDPPWPRSNRGVDE